MDVDKAFRAANQRLNVTLEQKCHAALARVGGLTLDEYAAKLEAEQVAAALARIVTQNQQHEEAVERIGAAYRQMSDAVGRMVESFARGWNRG